MRISNGTPPAARIASFITSAIASRCEKHAARFDELSTTAILGFSQSASDGPMPNHCALRTAPR